MIFDVFTVVVYIGGWLVCARIVAMHLISEDGEADMADRVMNGFLGVIAGMFWPALLLGLVLTRELKSRR